MARGPVVIIAYLALVSIVLIVVLATLVWVTGDRDSVIVLAEN